MNLDACAYNHSYKVTAINLEDSIAKERLASLGIVAGVIITILQTSAKKATISVQVHQTIIALRNEEARQIQVELI
ncbi:MULTISPECIES: FeoA family protein [Helicobacter]|uniref:Ferrous ion transport protein A n=2 Tax=Helicobacter TaxID=209 RepID=A0A377J3K6_9HELI|nr:MULTISPECIES: FeoA family protein [Helicobacter]MDL0079496.1 ferrous iron transport protein A [Helicobacter sp. CPD2-1]MDL0081603.1 ferrous iron transport protein A [Helicobacter sp. XJK30-2]STO96396.1 ferrous ion transport protein A [Helicobacter canis]